MVKSQTRGHSVKETSLSWGEYWILSMCHYSENKKAVTDGKLLTRPSKIENIGDTFCYLQVVYSKNDSEPRMSCKIDFFFFLKKTNISGTERLVI